ncbi:acetoin utilization AcuB family protein [Metabacillus iocasae]|uniref:Acetoin utilization protein AcuB n=1 Tax=Priestia iocasae TaxID=2291674 RepID=A0ABS2QP12_9BACI|nr:acetoin utilization AcuB family protein [Metabacillus iocasae]MBM7701188.1 acetoin utilization protein AcuB [Metabacillus iocasae]
MIVEEMMIQDVITLRPTNTIEEAIKLLEEHKIRHIPIVNDHNELAGIISDRDVRDASPSIFHRNTHLEDLQQPIQSIMKTSVITAHPLDFVEEVASVFYEYQIGCLPITKNNKLVGIITERDLLHTLIQLTGAHQPGSQIEVKVENKAGVLSEVTSMFRKHKINILSVLVYPDKDDRYKVIVFRIQTLNPTVIITELKQEGYDVLWPNLPGISL